MLYFSYYLPELNVDPPMTGPQKHSLFLAIIGARGGFSPWHPLSMNELWKEISFSLACIVHSVRWGTSTDGDQ